MSLEDLQNKLMEGITAEAKPIGCAKCGSPTRFIGVSVIECHPGNAGGPGGPPMPRNCRAFFRDHKYPSAGVFISVRCPFDHVNILCIADGQPSGNALISHAVETDEVHQ